jgi:hypothetical protein
MLGGPLEVAVGAAAVGSMNCRTRRTEVVHDAQPMFPTQDFCEIGEIESLLHRFGRLVVLRGGPARHPS